MDKVIKSELWASCIACLDSYERFYKEGLLDADEMIDSMRLTLVAIRDELEREE